jgi:hypothetical protein
MRRLPSVAALALKVTRDSISASKKVFERIVAVELEPRSPPWSSVAAMQAGKWAQWVIEAKKHFVFVATMRPWHWMRSERQLESQLVAPVRA